LNRIVYFTYKVKRAKFLKPYDRTTQFSAGLYCQSESSVGQSSLGVIGVPLLLQQGEMGRNSSIFIEGGEEGLSKVEGDYGPHSLL
jgi:hypothetical protein